MSNLDNLPLFATDKELALAIVGKERAAMWVKTVIPQLERKGFPRIDPLHDGRPVPLVKKFYDGYFGITAGSNMRPPDGHEQPTTFTPVEQRSAALMPKLKLDSRSETVLRYMIKNPKARTQRDMRGVGELTLQRVAEHGVIEAGGLNPNGDRIWTVTDAGRDEIKRIDYWYYGKT